MRELQADAGLRDELEGFLPGCLDQFAVAPDEGMLKAVRVRADVVPEKAPRAEVAVVAAGAVGGHDLDQVVLLGLNRDLAAVPAVRANGVGSLQHPRTELVHGQAAGEGADRTDLNAPPAELAVQFMVGEVLDLGHRPAAGRRQRFDIHHFVAVPHAAQALDAPVHLRLDQRAEVLLLEHPLDLDEPAGGRRVLMRKILQVAAAALVADRAVQRMVGQDKLQHRLVRLGDDGRRGAHHHALGNRRAARGLQLRRLLDLHQTHAAVGVPLQLGVVAEVGDHHPHLPRRLDDKRALRSRDRYAVDRQVNHFFIHTIAQCRPAMGNISSGRPASPAASASRISSSYSSRQCCSVERTGAIAASPKAQTVRPAMF